MHVWNNNSLLLCRKKHDRLCNSLKYCKPTFDDLNLNTLRRTQRRLVVVC